MIIYAEFILLQPQFCTAAATFSYFFISHMTGWFCTVVFTVYNLKLLCCSLYYYKCIWCGCVCIACCDYCLSVTAVGVPIRRSVGDRNRYHGDNRHELCEQQPSHWCPGPGCVWVFQGTAHVNLHRSMRCLRAGKLLARVLITNINYHTSYSTSLRSLHSTEQ